MRRSVTTLDNIARIAAPGPEELDRRYARTGLPVVLTGLFPEGAVARLSVPAVARAELGHLPLPAPYLGLGMPQDPWLSHMSLVGPGDVTPRHYDQTCATWWWPRCSGASRCCAAGRRGRLPRAATVAVLGLRAGTGRVAVHPGGVLAAGRGGRRVAVGHLPAAAQPVPRAPGGVGPVARRGAAAAAASFRDDEAVAPWAREAFAALTASL